MEQIIIHWKCTGKIVANKNRKGQKIISLTVQQFVEQHFSCSIEFCKLQQLCHFCNFFFCNFLPKRVSSAILGSFFNLQLLKKLKFYCIMITKINANDISIYLFWKFLININMNLKYELTYLQVGHIVTRHEIIE